MTDKYTDTDKKRMIERKPKKHIILRGQKYGRLTVVREVKHITKSGNHIRRFLCKCDCGKDKEIFIQKMLHWKRANCGCLGRPKVSDKTKLKLKISHIGYKPSLESLKRRSLSMRGKNAGEKCIFWKGGISDKNLRIRMLSEYREWRTNVFERDNYTCKECGARCGNGKTVVLQAHHIKSFADYPELRLVVDNGVTLCITCHKKTDGWGRPYKKLTI